ncbi:MAG: VTT domain-containing protein, partial [Nanoarchaeota archaeon]|nr:VTT domain-containing protein [Nanoarchaeota archaeon]
MKEEVFEEGKWTKIIKIFLRVLVVVILFFVIKELISDVDSITRLAKAAGPFGPIVLILLIMLGTLLTPIPSVVLVIAAGYLYGIWPGALYSYIGLVLAAVSMFFFVRLFKIKAKGKHYEKYKKLVKKNKKII